MREPKKTKTKSLPHTRAVQRDRSKRATGMPPDEAWVEQMEAVVHPAVYGQMDLYRAMGLRTRILSLPVMVALVLGMLWRQIGSVREAVRVLHDEGMLWMDPIEGVTVQALLTRMSCLPADLFYRVLMDCLPTMRSRAQARQRPVPRAVAWAQQHFHTIWAFDGSTLDGLLKKCGLLRDHTGVVLAGKIGTVLDVVTQLPAHIWYEVQSQAHDHSFWPQLLPVMKAGCLLLVDIGLMDFAIFDQLTDLQAGFITRPKSNTRTQVTQVLSKTAMIHDSLIVLGSPQAQCQHPMRLVEVLFHGKWYRYLTNVTDPTFLPAECVVALYDQRWRIEDAFNVIKRLLGLAYFHTSSLNGLQIQVWATWLLYALLIDLTDAVADALHRPFKDLSLEMVFRGLYHFTRDRHKGRASDPVDYFARRAKDLDLIKQKRSKQRLSLVEQMNLTIPLVP
jgi:hypothetical protein